MKTKPNILFIMTDQQSAEMMSCAGNRYLKTPAMDELAERGVRFELAYSPSPSCVPSRTAMLTGIYPARLDLSRNEDQNNLKGKIPQNILENTMGKLLSQGGYKCFFGGKTHWIKGLDYEACGFENLTSDTRDDLVEKTARFLKQEHDTPFLLVASFINPHDICYHSLDAVANFFNVKKVNPKGVSERANVNAAITLAKEAMQSGVYEEKCPPLRANAEFTDGVEQSDIGNRHPKTDPHNPHPLDIYYHEELYVNQMTKDEWRLYSWIYHRLAEDVDRQIGIVLDALKESGLEDNTIVVFTSDHGEMNGAHKLVAKNSFYEESARVPFIIAGPEIQEGVVDTTHLLSASLDLIPTFCDYARVDIPKMMHGKSIRKIAEGYEPKYWRNFVVSEGVNGRMLRTQNHKYIYYKSGNEALFDMKIDTGEMENLAADPKYKDQMDGYKTQLKQWVELTNDSIALGYLK